MTTSTRWPRSTSRRASSRITGSGRRTRRGPVRGRRRGGSRGVGPHGATLPLERVSVGRAAKPRAPRPQPVLLARRRGDGAPPRRALRGARRRVRRHGRHRRRPRPRGLAARGDAERRPDRARPLDRLRPLAARTCAPRTTSPTSPTRSRRRCAAPRPDLVLCMTDPPMVGDIALARRPPLRRAAARDQPGRLPGDRGRAEAAREPARRRRCCARSSASTSSAPTASSRSARRCGAGSRRRATPPDRLAVIPNWVDTDAITPQPRDNEWARENGLADRSSSCTRATSATRRTSTRSIRAATFLRDLDDLAIVIVGFGARHDGGGRARPAARGRHASASSRTSRATCSRSRSRRPTSTSSGSRAGCPATSSRAASTGSSPPAGR